MELQAFHRGERIITQGEIGDKLYVLHRGVVDIEVDRQTVGRLDATAETKPSQKPVFGEMALFGADKTRRATVQCATFCLCTVLHIKIFDRLLEKYPGDRDELSWLVVKRLVQQDLPRCASSSRTTQTSTGHPKAPPGLASRAHTRTKARNSGFRSTYVDGIRRRGNRAQAAS